MLASQEEATPKGEVVLTPKGVTLVLQAEEDNSFVLAKLLTPLGVRQRKRYPSPKANYFHLWWTGKEVKRTKNFSF